MTATQTLTIDDIGRGYDDDRWLGWGYLGGRQSIAERFSASELTRADQRVIDHANACGWDYERLFAWLNSKPGRWYADDPFGMHAVACLAMELDD